MQLFIYEVLGYFIGKKSSRLHLLLYLSVVVCVYLVKRFTPPLWNGHDARPTYQYLGIHTLRRKPLRHAKNNKLLGLIFHAISLEAGCLNGFARLTCCSGSFCGLTTILSLCFSCRGVRISMEISFLFYLWFLYIYIICHRYTI